MKRKVCLAVTANHDKIEKDFMMTLMQMQKPFEWVVSLKGQHIKSGSLNEHLVEASNADCTHIFFMDVDMQFPSVILPKLLSHNLPIVSGLYHLKNSPFSPIAGWASEEGHAVNGNGRMWKEDYCPLPVNSLVEVHWCGIGALLVDMDVFNKIYFPPFRDTWNEEAGCRQKGHDILFCEAARKAGYKIFVDTTMDCSHVGRILINRLYIESYHALGMDQEMIRRFQSYTREAAYWDEKYLSVGVEKERCLKPVVEFIGKKVDAGSSVIDIGCGDGNTLRLLKTYKQCDVYGMDFSPVSISILRHKGIPGEVADIKTYSPNGRRADTVIMSHLLEHIPDEQVDRVVATIASMADKQAFVVVPQEKELWYEHVRFYNEDLLRKHLEPHFDSVEIEKILPESEDTRWVYRHIIAHCRNPKRESRVSSSTG